MATKVGGKVRVDGVDKEGGGEHGSWRFSRRIGWLQFGWEVD